MRNPRVWLVVALVAVLGGAFLVQASSTWRLGDHHHLADVALPALVLVLEVGSVTGAALYIATRNRGTRFRAGLLVAIATGVGATGGVQAYGVVIGTAIAAVLLLMVDIIGRFWHEAATAVDQPVEQVEPAVAEPEFTPVEPVTAPMVEAVDEPVEPVEQVVEVADGYADSPGDVVSHDSRRSTEPEPINDHIDWTLSERRLAAELGITRHAARQLKAARTEVAS